MDKILQVVVKATGGWGFHFGVTKEQAYKILNARIDEQVELNEPGETLTVMDNETLRHFMRRGKGATGEDLDRASTLCTLEKLIEDNAWNDSEN